MTQASEVVVAGRSVRLGQRIGRGGEGEVYALDESPERAVKIYSVAKRASREPKVAAMVRSRLAHQSHFVAYPIEIARYKNGAFAGFVMKLVNGCKPIFELYAPGARKVSFPKADFRFLVRTATNVARAVASVHKSGCVIGDINHSGILVSDKATVTLIDADSFQVVRGDKRYLCRVGVPEYTPPELHGSDLGATTRTTNHDAFGLAVIIFQLLFMGRHPFVGTVRKGEVPKIDHAIRDFRFVYTESRNVGMDQPPGTPALSDFTSAIAERFEQSFGRNSVQGRPSAESWVGALGELERSLTRCDRNDLHYYPKDASECPWCFMDGQLGMTLFIPYIEEASFATWRDPGDANFDLVAVWQQIQSIGSPSSSALKPKLQTIQPTPSPEALAAKSGSGSRRLMGLLGIAGAVGLAFIAPPAWFIYIPLGWWGFSSLFSEATVARGPFIENSRKAESQWRMAHDDWERRCGIQEFRELESELRAAKESYERLATQEEARIDDYRKRRREIQLARYLEGFQIHRARIRGIGPAKEATLASYGIETAADITRAKVLGVPGFGPVTTQPLLDWRRSKEQRFVYNQQPNALDDQEIKRIRAEIASQRSQARHRLLAGRGKKRRLLERIRSSAGVVDSRLNTIHKRREQARADLHYLRIPEPQFTYQVPISTSRRPPGPRPARTPTRSMASPTSTPSCPRCGSRMVMRLARRGRNAGNHFWGCSRFPSCRGTQNL